MLQMTRLIDFYSDTHVLAYYSYPTFRYTFLFPRLRFMNWSSIVNFYSVLSVIFV